MKNTRAVAHKAIRRYPTSLFGARELHGTWPIKAVLPAQFFIPAQDSHAVWTGERRLMLAVLQEAFHTYRRYHNSSTRHGRRLFEEARQWFCTRENAGFYSFERICQHLYLDPGYLRRRLVHEPRQIAEYRNYRGAGYRRVTP